MNLPAASFLRLEKTGAVIVDVHVMPHAAQSRADGLHDGALRVRLKAVPVDGKANQALILWLADTLGVARSSVELVRGATSRRKQLRVTAQAAAAADWLSLVT
ncbi:DUF167 domain-containing protein [Variovorax terrae]|uniref:UPF0235 protein MMF98_02210 n=1 Tax=Variovorax terrae TaxID=2923278 RepID=A0A9X1VSA9_9BURK|nr:DUF167 domain-containing protein [Variovorax terrae]MCJ0762015.1 DUF167 domain-containing protein [Variovorax terrae]